MPKETGIASTIMNAFDAGELYEYHKGVGQEGAVEYWKALAKETERRMDMKNAEGVVWKTGRITVSEGLVLLRRQQMGTTPKKFIYDVWQVKGRSDEAWPPYTHWMEVKEPLGPNIMQGSPVRSFAESFEDAGTRARVLERDKDGAPLAHARIDALAETTEQCITQLDSRTDDIKNALECVLKILETLQSR